MIKLIKKILTVRPCAINSSGTNSGLNFAGVTQGKEVFCGNNVTITSPLAEKFNSRVTKLDFF